MPENNQILSVEGQLVGMPLAGPESFSQQQLDYLKRALGVDETVLWEGSALVANNASVTLNEAVENFTKVVIYGKPWSSYRDTKLGEAIIPNQGTNVIADFVAPFMGNNGGAVRFVQCLYNIQGTTVTMTYANQFSIQGTSVSTATPSGTYITKVVGIGRRESA